MTRTWQLLRLRRSLPAAVGTEQEGTPGMQIMVIVLEPEFHKVTFEGPWLEQDTRDGELRITTRNLDGEVTGWTVYAGGQWSLVQLQEPPSADVLRHRAALAERDRITAPPPNSGGWLSSPIPNTGSYPPGNSGPN